MERAHCKLCSRLTNRLRRDHTNSLTDIHICSTSQITTVAFATDTSFRLTQQGRADQRLINTCIRNAVSMFLGHHLASRKNNLTGFQINHILSQNTTKDTIKQRIDDLTAVHHRADCQALRGATVNLVDNTILRNIDKTPCQIPRVRRFQRRVGKSLSRTVCRVEILQNIQPLFERGNDRCFDDLTRWLGHQAPHTGKLFDLRRRTTRT